MTDDDRMNRAAGAARGWLDDLHLAAGFLTRVVPAPQGDAGARPLAEAARVFPLVGAALGLAAGVVFAAAARLGLPPSLAAICALGVLVLATGALHEDGLGDTADGFGGGGGREQKLAIMRDSRTGVYGMIAIALGLIARLAAIAALAGPGAVLGALIAAGAVSRAAMPAVMRSLSPARGDGLGASAGRPARNDVIIGIALAAAIALVTVGIGAAIVALAACALVAKAAEALARRQIGGHTGDVLGAVQQACEIAALFVFVALQ